MKIVASGFLFVVGSLILSVRSFPPSPDFVGFTQKLPCAGSSV